MPKSGILYSHKPLLRTSMPKSGILYSQESPWLYVYRNRMYTEIRRYPLWPRTVRVAIGIPKTGSVIAMNRRGYIPKSCILYSHNWKDAAQPVRVR
jgi:hypothetical protein